MLQQQLKKDRSYYWQKLVAILSACAELSNIGIVLEAAAHWSVLFARLAAYGIFPYLILVTDPLIYFFRGMVRLLRLVGRTCFNIRFEEEKDGTHRFQSFADIASLCCFALAIGFLVGMIAPPIGITLGWLMGLAGLGIIGYFDYIWPARRAKNAYQICAKQEGATPDDIEVARKAYVVKRNSMMLYMALLFGLSMLLICGSAVAFAPPLLVPVLVIAVKIASVYLVAIAIGRFTTWVFSGCYQRRKANANLVNEEKNESNNTSTILMVKEGLVIARPSVTVISTVAESLPKDEQAILENNMVERQDARVHIWPRFKG